MDATGGYPGGVWYSSLLYVTARPATKAPVTSLCLRGRRCTAAPNETRTDQHRTYRNLCCTWYDAYVRHSGTLRIVRMALLTEPVPRSVRQVWPLLRARTWDRTTEARTGPGPLYSRNGKRPPTIQRTCDDTASWPPRRPADGQQRAALRERVTGHSPGV